MTPNELSETLAILHWSGRTLAGALGIDESTVRRFRRGDRAIPDPIAAWLRALAAAHRRLPPPAVPQHPSGIGRPLGSSLSGLQR